jgi:hypothetical protein
MRDALFVFLGCGASAQWVKNKIPLDKNISFLYHAPCNFDVAASGGAYISISVQSSHIGFDFL